MSTDKPIELLTIKLKIELNRLSLWSASIQSIRSHCQYGFTPGSGDIHVAWCLIWLIGDGEVILNPNETGSRPQFAHKVSGTKSPAMLDGTLTELWSIKLKIWTQQTAPMISEHSAHSTQLLLWFHPWLWQYTYLLVLILMHWQQKIDIESKKMETSCLPLLNGGFEPKISGNEFSSRPKAHSQTDWAIEDLAKTLNSICSPCDQQAFSPLNCTTNMASALALDIYKYVFINFAVLATGKWYRIKWRQCVFLCWMQIS